MVLKKEEKINSNNYYTLIFLCEVESFCFQERKKTKSMTGEAYYLLQSPSNRAIENLLMRHRDTKTIAGRVGTNFRLLSTAKQTLARTEKRRYRQIDRKIERKRESYREVG